MGDASQIQEPRLPGSVVKPKDAVQIVAGAPLRPPPRQELGQGKLRLPAEVFRHEAENALIAGGLVIGPKREQRNHVRPEIRRGVRQVTCFGVIRGKIGARPEVAVGALASKHGVNPAPRFVNHALVLERERESRVTAQPVRKFFPPRLPLAFHTRPGVAVEAAIGADLGQPARQALRH